MRKMMMAVMFTAACGSIAMWVERNDNGSDSGSDVGMGSGSGSGGPATCNTAADCAAGTACDVDQHMCVTAAFTIDKTGFIDDGTRWWTSKANPTLHGTIDNPSGETLTLSINNTPIGTATITGTTWSIDLPAGAIAESDTAVDFRLSSGVEQRQLFALDDKAPVAVLFGSIKDERGDQIDFSTGEPVHTHAGASVTLDGTGCPAVYKYAYLMDATKPLYGSETSPNPFTWQVKASDSTPIDNMDSAYRVRDASGTVLYNWTSIEPDTSGVFSITLHRNDIAALGNKTGHMFVDVRFRDTFGNESTTSACWDNHPMAVPLDVDVPTQGPMFGWTLAADSPVSSLEAAGKNAVLFTQEIVQHASEPVAMTIGVPGVAMPYTHKDVDDLVPEAPVTVSLDCTTTPSNCASSVPADPADRSSSGTMTLSSSNTMVTVYDESTNQAVCSALGPAITSGCTIPARAANSSPHRYRFQVTLYNARELMPFLDKQGPFEDYGEYALLGLTYTGLPAKPVATICSHVMTRVIQGTTYTACTEQTSYDELLALDALTLQMPATTVALQTAINATATPSAPANLTQAQLTAPARLWNAGNDDLPGPQ